VGGEIGVCGLFSDEFAERDRVGKTDVELFVDVARGAKVDNPNLIEPVVLEAIQRPQSFVIVAGTVTYKEFAVVRVERKELVENAVKKGCVLFAGLNPNDISLDSVGKACR
jgi:hypothetical protein